MAFQAYRFSNTIMLYLAFAAFLNMLEVRGAIHVVGDRNGWNIVTDSTNWARGKEFHVGDVLGKFRIHIQ